MSNTNSVTIHCSICNGQNIRADAYAEWNAGTQGWELSNVFDARICEDCGHEVSAYEQAIDTATDAPDGQWDNQ